MLTNLDDYDLKRIGFSCGHKKFIENLVKIGVKIWGRWNCVFTRSSIFKEQIP